MHKCPDISTLTAFATGTLDEDKMAKLSAHIDQCSDCIATLETLTSHDATLISAVAHARQDEFAQEAPCQQVTEEIASGLPSQEQTPPRSLGPYELLSEIGAGGIGTVFKARHRHLNKIVALKVLQDQDRQDKDAILRFEREMRVAGSIDHPNVVTATDGGHVDGQYYLVMEFLNGTDLSSLSSRVGPLRPADACEIIRRAAVGLQAIHEHDLIHRDIKPRNMMLVVTSDQSVDVKILDFGLVARQFASADDMEALTSTGQVMGTIDYMAPEQGLDSSAVDIRADIYGLGASLFRLLTGRTLFHGDAYRSLGRKFNAILNEDRPQVSQLRDDLPPGLDELVAQLLQRHPERRPQTPAEMAEQLTPFCQSAKIAALIAEHLPEKPKPGPVPVKDWEQETAARHAVDTIPTSPVLEDTRIAPAVVAPPASQPDANVHPDSEIKSKSKPDDKPQVDHRAAAAPPRAAKHFGWLVAAATAVLLLASVIYVETGKCTLKISVNDPDISVRIVGDTVEIGDDQSTRVYPGEQQLVIQRGDLKFTTDTFSMSRGETELIVIERLDDDIKVVRAGTSTQIGEHIIPQQAAIAAVSDVSTDPTPQSGPPPIPEIDRGPTVPSQDRAAAELVLSGFGMVRLEDHTVVSRIEDLPVGPLRVTAIDYDTELSLNGKPTFDMDRIEVLNGLQHLVEFRCFRGLGDESLAKLTQLPALRRLTIGCHPENPEEPTITDASLPALAQFQLKLFSLCGSAMTDAAIASLLRQPGYRDLETLIVTDSVVGVETLAAIAELKQLRLLRLERNLTLTEQEFDRLGELKHVHYIDLSGTNVSANMLKTLCRMPSLQFVSLSRTELTVEDLKMLTEIPTLDNLLISGFEEQLKQAGDDPLPGFTPSVRDHTEWVRVRTPGP